MVASGTEAKPKLRRLRIWSCNIWEREGDGAPTSAWGGEGREAREKLVQALWEWRAGDRGRSREEVERTIVKMLRRRGQELGSHHWDAAAQGGYQGRTWVLRVAVTLREGSLALRWHLVLGTGLRRLWDRAAAWPPLMRARRIWKKGLGQLREPHGACPARPCPTHPADTRPPPALQVLTAHGPRLPFCSWQTGRWCPWRGRMDPRPSDVGETSVPGRM